MAEIAKPALDVERLWQLQRLGGLSLAPDGRRAVCSVTRHSMADNKASSALWLLSTEGATARQLTRCGDRDGQATWSPLGDRIAFVARRTQQAETDETPQLYLIDPDGGEAQRVTAFAPGIETFRWLPDGQQIVFSAWLWPSIKGIAAQCRQQKQFDQRKETGYVTSSALYRYWDDQIPQDRALHLCLLDLRTGRINDLFEGTGLSLPLDSDSESAYAISPDGLRLAFVHDPEPQPKVGNRCQISEMSLSTRKLRTLASDPDWDFETMVYSPNGRSLATTAAETGRVHTAFSELVIVDLKSRKRRMLSMQPELSVDSAPQWSANSQSLLFTAPQNGREPLWQISAEGGVAEKLFAGGSVHQFESAAGTVAVLADSAMHPAQALAWRLTDAANSHAEATEPKRLENFNDEVLAQVQLSQVREVHITGALGEQVQMWLHFPLGLDPDSTKRGGGRKGSGKSDRHPVTHVIHGGPYGAAGDTFGYRWNPHVLASQGHVIAQVNFHGSSGFGWAFSHSLMGRQGELETQDIEAATDWLQQQPWADPKRFFATGGSYGGFLVAWMNGHVAPGRYRAYVCHAGVFDRIATFSADSYPVRPKDLAANYWQDMPRVLSQSPHASAANMRTPTLVIHGAKDYRVPDCNGLAYYNTLKALGVDARLLWFPDENHWVLKPRNSKLWYGEFVAWLKANGG